MADTLQKFMIDQSLVRGELVEITDTWQQIQSRRQYPRAVKTMLGEMLSAAALLSANLKFNGAIILQIHGDGPVQLLVVECDADLKLRAMAKLREDATVEDDATLQQLVNLHGEGRFAITLDPNDKMPGQQAYQGIVALDGDSVATVIENYMLRSEQLDTRLWLAADDTVSRGLLLQKLPAEGGTDVPVADDNDTWDRSVMLASTLSQNELLSTDIMTLLQRLYWEELNRAIRCFSAAAPASASEICSKCWGKKRLIRRWKSWDNSLSIASFADSITASIKSTAPSCLPLTPSRWRYRRRGRFNISWCIN